MSEWMNEEEIEKGKGCGTEFLFGVSLKESSYE